jgi:predicted ATPase
MRLRMLLHAGDQRRDEAKYEGQQYWPVPQQSLDDQFSVHNMAAATTCYTPAIPLWLSRRVASSCKWSLMGGDVFRAAGISFTTGGRTEAIRH